MVFGVWSTLVFADKTLSDVASLKDGPQSYCTPALLEDQFRKETFYGKASGAFYFLILGFSGISPLLIVASTGEPIARWRVLTAERIASSCENFEIQFVEIEIDGRNLFAKKPDVRPLILSATIDYGAWSLHYGQRPDLLSMVGGDSVLLAQASKYVGDPRYEPEYSQALSDVARLLCRAIANISATKPGDTFDGCYRQVTTGLP